MLALTDPDRPIPGKNLDRTKQPELHIGLQVSAFSGSRYRHGKGAGRARLADKTILEAMSTHGICLWPKGGIRATATLATEAGSGGPRPASWVCWAGHVRW